MTRTRARVDKNQDEIVALLRSWPAVTVQSLASVGGGVPDLLVGYKQMTVLVEVKGVKGKLTTFQEDWHGRWTGAPVVIVRSQEDAIKLLQNIDAIRRHLPHVDIDITKERDD
jgi:hypothetical protein